MFPMFLGREVHH